MGNSHGWRDRVEPGRRWRAKLLLGILFAVTFAQLASRPADPLAPSRQVTDLPFSANVQLNDDAPHDPDCECGQPSLAWWGGTLFLAWRDKRIDGGGDIYFARSIDRGLTWSDPNVRVNTDPTGPAKGQASPVIAVAADGTVYIAWEDTRDLLAYIDIYLGRSTDGGDTWTDHKVDAAATGVLNADPDLAVDAVGTVHVVWSQGNDTADVFYSHSVDGGETWSQATRVNENVTAGWRGQPTLVVDAGGRIHVAWYDDRLRGGDDPDVWYAWSDDGSSWSRPDKRLSTVPGDDPSLALGPSGELYVAYRAYGTADGIYFARSLDGGGTWSDPNLAVPTFPEIADEPSLAVDDGGVVAVAYRGSDDLNAEIYVARSSDQGDTWSTPVIASHDDGVPVENRQSAPALAAGASEEWFVAWVDLRHALSIYLSSSPDAGASWASPDILVNSRPWSAQQAPVLAGDGAATLYALYADDRDEWQTTRFTRSTDAGASWAPSRPVDVSPGPDSVTYRGLVVAPSGGLHVVGTAWQNGSYQVFASHSLDGGSTWAGAVQVSGGDWDHLSPAIAVDRSGNLLTAWVDYATGWLDRNISSSRSTDGGGAWGAAVRASDDGPAWTGAPSVGFDGSGAAYIAWDDDRDGTAHIRIARSPGGGDSWSPSVLVSTVSGDSSSPSLAIAASGSLYVAWETANPRTDIYSAASTDSGATWTDPNALVDADPAPYGRSQPSLITDAAGLPVVAWIDGATLNVEVARSLDGGASWTSPPLIADDDPLISWKTSPTLAAGPGGAVFSAWTDQRRGDSNIFSASLGVVLPAPPTAVGAALINSGADVKVNWTLSSPESEVDHYAVWRSSTYDPVGAGYVQASPSLPPGTTEWTDAGAALGAADYFYTVRAVAATGANARSPGQAAKLGRSLLAGPNLLSTSLILEDSAVDSVLAPLAGWSVARSFDSADGTDPWKADYSSGTRPAGDLASLDRGAGFWLTPSAPGDFRVAGRVPCSTAIVLQPGWNLVGYPGMTARTVAELTAGTSFLRLEGEDPGAPYHLRALAAGDMLGPTDALWVLSPGTQVWVVVNDPSATCV